MLSLLKNKNLGKVLLKYQTNQQKGRKNIITQHFYDTFSAGQNLINSPRA